MTHVFGSVYIALDSAFVYASLNWHIIWQMEKFCGVQLICAICFGNCGDYSVVDRGISAIE